MPRETSPLSLPNFLQTEYGKACDLSAMAGCLERPYWKGSIQEGSEGQGSAIAFPPPRGQPQHLAKWTTVTLSSCSISAVPGAGTKGAPSFPISADGPAEQHPLPLLLRP